MDADMEPDSHTHLYMYVTEILITLWSEQTNWNVVVKFDNYLPQQKQRSSP